MRPNVLLGCLMFFSCFFAYSQAEDKVSGDSITYTPRQKDSIVIDSLVKYVRQEFYKQNYDVVIERGYDAQQQANALGLAMDYFMVSSRIGNSFLKIEDTLQAQEVFVEALSQAKQQDSLKYLVSAQIDLGNVYAIQKKNEKAISNYKEAIPIATRLQDSARLFILNYNIADISIDDNNISFSTPYVEQTDIYIQALEKYEAYRAVHQILKGRYYLESDTNRALPYLREGLSLAKSSNYSDAIIDGLAHLAKALDLSGNSREAYQLTLQRDSVKNEKYKLDKINAIEAATAQYKVTQYEQEIENQQREAEFKAQETRRTTTIFWVQIAALILLISSVILFISNRKRKKALQDLKVKNKEYLEEKQRSEALSKAKTTLFSNISHELRTPMYGIIGVTDILMEDQAYSSKADHLKSLKFSADYLLSLINNVVLLNKLDANLKEPLEKDRIDIRTIISQVVGASQYLNTEQPNTYEITIEEEVPTYVVGDRMKITQVLLNLIGNATKFTQNGTVSVRVSSTSNSDESKIPFHFTITDNGSGIPKDKIPQLFNEFSKTSTGEHYQGTGLGLPIVKKILDRHDSELHIESNVGKGTELQFTINYLPYESETKEAQEKKSSNEVSLAGRSILIVDDNRINQIVTQKMLHRSQADTLLASSGLEAIALVKENNVDLILMDINMPEMNGYETTLAIKELHPSLPVVALSAMELSTIQAHPDAAILDDIIIKPYKAETFFQIIRKHL